APAVRSAYRCTHSSPGRRGFETLRPVEMKRRELLKWLGAAAAAGALPAGCSSGVSPEPPGSFFTLAERQALSALADAVLPPDDTPGGAALGAVAYIEGLVLCLEG